MHVYNHKSENLLTRLWSPRRGDGVEARSQEESVFSTTLCYEEHRTREGPRFKKKSIKKKSNRGSNMHSSTSDHRMGGVCNYFC